MPWISVSPPPGPGSSSSSSRLGLAPAAASAHRAASARAPPAPTPRPARSCQRSPLLPFLLLRPSAPLRTPSPSTPAPPPPPLLARLWLPPALRSGSLRCRSPPLALSALSSFLSARDQSTGRKSTQACWWFQVRSPTLTPAGTLFPSAFASRACLSARTLSPAPWEPRMVRVAPSSRAHLRTNFGTHLEKRKGTSRAVRDARPAARSPGSFTVSNFARRAREPAGRAAPGSLALPPARWSWAPRTAGRRGVSQQLSPTRLPPPRRGLWQLCMGREGA